MTNPKENAASGTVVNPTGEQLYTMVTGRFKYGSSPWAMVAQSGKDAWDAAAAELVFAPDTIMAEHGRAMSGKVAVIGHIASDKSNLEEIAAIVAAQAAPSREAAPMDNSAAVAAIQFALADDDGWDFLNYWNEGEFDLLRRNWPEAPEDVYIGADPMHPATRAALARHSAEPAPSAPAAPAVRWLMPDGSCTRDRKYGEQYGGQPLYLAAQPAAATVGGDEPKLPEKKALGMHFGGGDTVYGHTDETLRQYASDYAAWANAAGVPEGYKLVPVTDTNQMMTAAYEACWQAGDTVSSTTISAIYRAMVAAAPSQPVEPK